MSGISDQIYPTSSPIFQIAKSDFADYRRDMEAILRDHIIRLTDAYLPASGLKLSTVSQRAAGDWRWLRHVLDGGNFSVRKFDEAVIWFSSNWPERADWPSEVPRPVAPVVAVLSPSVEVAA